MSSWWSWKVRKSHVCSSKYSKTVHSLSLLCFRQHPCAVPGQACAEGGPAWGRPVCCCDDGPQQRVLPHRVEQGKRSQLWVGQDLPATRHTGRGSGKDKDLKNTLLWHDLWPHTSLLVWFKQIFQEIEPLVTSCIDGYHVCIFAYGQTGSGKTYTMEVNTNFIAWLHDLCQCVHWQRSFVDIKKKLIIMAHFLIKRTHCNLLLHLFVF